MGNRKLNPMRSTLPGPKLVVQSNARAVPVQVSNPAPQLQTSGYVTIGNLQLSTDVYSLAFGGNDSLLEDAAERELVARLDREEAQAWKKYNQMIEWATDETLQIFLRVHKPQRTTYNVLCGCMGFYASEPYLEGCIGGEAYEHLNRRQVTDKAIADGMPAALAEGML